MKKSFLDKIFTHKYVRPAVLIILSFAFMFGVAAVVNKAYINGRDVLDYEEITLDSCVYSGLEYELSAKCNLPGKYISDFDYYVEDKTLHVTFYATPITEEFSDSSDTSSVVSSAPQGLEPVVKDSAVMTFDDNGYVTLEINVDKKPDKIVYAYGRYEKKLTVTDK